MKNEIESIVEHNRREIDRICKENSIQSRRKIRQIPRVPPGKLSLFILILSMWVILILGIYGLTGD